MHPHTAVLRCAHADVHRFAHTACAGLQAEEAELREATARAREAHDAAQAQLEVRRRRMRESDEEIAGGCVDTH